MNINVIGNIFHQQANECRMPCTTEYLMNVEASFAWYCLLIEFHLESTSNVTFFLFMFYFFDKTRKVKNKREKYPHVFDAFSTQLSITI